MQNKFCYRKKNTKGDYEILYAFEIIMCFNCDNNLKDHFEEKCLI